MARFASVDESSLREEYLEKKKSIKTIAIEWGCSATKIQHYLCVFGIPRRPKNQWKGRHHSHSSRKLIGLKSKGRIPSKQARRKMSLAGRGKAKSYFPKKRINQGYLHLWRPDHPMSNKGGYIYRHRLVMSQILGRNLSPNEIVHHINGDRSDNRPENLELTERKWHKDKHKSKVICPKCLFHFSLSFSKN